MKLQDIVRTVNEMLAGERHTYLQLRRLLDKTIDDINAQLNSTYPAFSDLPDGTADYDLLPDRYIRSVVCTGTAWYYFTQDEEGIETAPQYGMMYERGLFLMTRDFFNEVPPEYQQTHVTPVYPDHSTDRGERGVNVDAWNIQP